MLGTDLDQYFERLEAVGFSGVVLAAKDDRVILERGYGLSMRERRTPNTVATVFSIGSISEQFTAAAILKLESHGKLTTEDPSPASSKVSRRRRLRSGSTDF